MSKTIFNIIQSNTTGGGMENIFLDYSQILKQNHNLIAVVSKDFIHLEALRKAGITVEILDIKGHFDFMAAFKLRSLIKKYSPELIIAHNGRGFAAINLARKFGGFKKIKLLAVSHGGSVKRILKFDYIIAVARHIEDKIRAENFKGKVRTIYNGIKIVSYQKPSRAGQGFNFGILSRLSAEKNIEIAIHAFKKFSVRNSHLIIAGEGSELDNLKKLSGNNPNIKFTGWVNNKRNFFDQINIFLQPSSNEPFGLTILEAFNYQTPVIAANTNGPKEIIKPELTGYLFAKGSVDSLHKTMENCYQNRSRLKKITEEAYRDLVNNFSYEKMEKELISFINDIV
ncbi:MAG: glycosyltransferase family 1 protein [Niabella sp.]|nr:MAG: glycosyltransferase family 1 protein [Niabella sp.]